MSSDPWIRHYEAIEAAHPELSDDELSELAEQAVRDDLADRVDAAKDAASEAPE